MSTPKRIVTTITALSLVLGGGVGIADAAQKSGAGKASGAGPAGPRGPGPLGGKAVAEYLGLTAAELRTQLQAGKTLAAVATAQGKTVSGLEDAIVADATTRLDADVAAGKLTAAAAAARLADLKSHVDDLVNQSGPPPGGHGPGHGHGPFDQKAVTDYLGLTAAELRTQLQAGKTLAEVAVAQGKTSSGLQDAIVAAATTKLDAAVAAGDLTATQESTMLADLKSHVADLITRTGPPAGGPKLGPIAR